MLFDGIVPVLTHTPPTSPRSITATDFSQLGRRDSSLLAARP
jgi:hypothetical protein